MQIVELETPEGVYPAHVLSTKYGTHYFVGGRASLPDEVVDELKKNGVEFKVVKADHPGGGVGMASQPSRDNSKRKKASAPEHRWGPGFTGDPYDRALAARSTVQGQEPAQNPTMGDKTEDEVLEDPIDRAHAGLPNDAAGEVRGTTTDTGGPAGVAAAREEKENASGSRSRSRTR